MILSVSLVVLLGVAVVVVVVVLCRYANLRAWHALLCVLFGFYRADSALAPSIAEAIGALLDAVSAADPQGGNPMNHTHAPARTSAPTRYPRRCRPSHRHRPPAPGGPA